MGKEHSAGRSAALLLLVHSESAAGVAVAIAYASER
jgi:hypothetical protein